ncbi:hypothetical protein SAMN05428950_10412 [Sphingomonas sp. OV641]|uniref:hypothetical protein n=1 Tax=Sphingomonas sp. OV641 TaxID=1881068 RepID=UPI0008C3ABEC|nr:hypothetical protein [Sphingomonas sp. OV641]SEJ86127.1 hypothetical protein SAMN05428950_10412 [Sphingomonas sp. OV641]
MKTLLAAAAMLLPPAAALLAGAPTSAAAQAVVMPAASPNVLRAGTPVALRLIEGLTTREKNARINDRVRLEVAEAVAVNGAVIIPVGSPAIGELTDVRNKGMWGKSGRIVGRVLSVNANGRTIRLSGTFDSKGGSGTAGAVAVSAVVFAPAGFFMTGKSADMPAGTMLRGFIEEDVPFALTYAAPITAPVAAPVAAPMLVSR